MTTQTKPQRALPRIPWWLGACSFAAIAVFFLWQEHKAHLLGALPWLLLFACPLIHLLMHRGHGHAHEGGSPTERDEGDHAHIHGGAS